MTGVRASGLWRSKVHNSQPLLLRVLSTWIDPTFNYPRAPPFMKSSKNSDTGSMPVTSRWSRARVQAT
jgi:hypothetical protein